MEENFMAIWSYGPTRNRTVIILSLLYNNNMNVAEMCSIWLLTTDYRVSSCTTYHKTVFYDHKPIALFQSLKVFGFF